MLKVACVHFWQKLIFIPKIMREKITVVIFRPAKTFITAIFSARNAYHACFSVDNSNLTQMDFTCFWNLLPEVWAEKNFVTLPTRLCVVKDCWFNRIHLFKTKQHYIVCPTQLYVRTYILSKRLRRITYFIIRLYNSLMMGHVIWNV
jgi:hypothetical protein